METKISSPTNIPFISLFSGGMGLDLGIEMAGFESVACVENDRAAVDTILTNRPSLPVLSKSVADVSGDELLSASGVANRDLPLLVGGPPCQAFSVIGNRKGLQDERGMLLFEYLRLVRELQPHVFIMENVRGLLSMTTRSPESDPQKNPRKRSGLVIDLLFDRFAKLGYRVDCFVVNAANYGAPQIRERVVFIGNRHGLVSTFPAPHFSNRPEDGLPPFRTLGDAIGEGFVDPCPEVMDFSPRKLRFLSLVPPGGNWRSLPLEIQKESMGKSWYLKGGRSAHWRKLSFAFPSPTVVTMPNHAGTSMCHPAELRAISVGEAAAIQEFPRNWRFAGTTSEKFRQIGNAVPVRLGRIAGEQARRLLSRIEAGEKPAQGAPQNSTVHLRPHVRTRSFWKNGEVFAGDQSYYSPKNNDSQLTLPW